MINICLLTLVISGDASTDPLRKPSSAALAATADGEVPALELLDIDEESAPDTSTTTAPPPPSAAQPLPDLIDHMYAHCDAVSKGAITFITVVKVLNVICRGAATERLKLFFDLHDRDGDGVLSNAEFTDAMNTYARVK